MLKSTRHSCQSNRQGQKDMKLSCASDTVGCRFQNDGHTSIENRQNDEVISFAVLLMILMSLKIKRSECKNVYTSLLI